IRIKMMPHERLASHTHPRAGARIRFRANGRVPKRWALPVRTTWVEPESRTHGRWGHRHPAGHRAVRAMGEIDWDRDRRSGEGQGREQDDVAGLRGRVRHTVARETLYELPH